MPINIRKTTSWRSIREIPAALIELWLRLRVRWHHNPGFVAAAVAGSIGLVLAVVLAVQGGLRLLEENPAGDGLNEDYPSAVLGATFDSDADATDPFSEEGARSRLNARLANPDDEEQWNPPAPASQGRAVAGTRASRKHLLDDDFDDTVTEEIDAAKRRNPLADDGDTDAVDSRGPHPLDEHPLAGEPSPPRRFPRKSALVEDAAADTEADVLDERVNEAPEETPARSADRKAARLKLDIAPRFGSAERDEADDADAETATESIQPAASIARSAPGGWKNQPQKSATTAESSSALTERSRSVETVIVAIPDRKAPAPGQGPRRHVAGRARVRLEIAGPRAALIGQACKFEIRVTNQGSATADNLTLSVELPDELVHQVGNSLEQHIAKLGPGQTYRALVRAQARASGSIVLTAEVADDDTIVARSSASVAIGAASRTSARADLPDCECLPLNQAR